MKVYVEFVNVPKGTSCVPQGPYDFVQERYGELVVDTDGTILATKDDGLWEFNGDKYTDMIVSAED